MSENPKQPEREVKVCSCTSCGRDFRVSPSEVIHPIQEEICPGCMSPYLLDED